MIEELKKSALFAGLSEAEIGSCLSCSKAKAVAYRKEEMIFLQTDRPDSLLVLLDGTVVVGSDSKDGRRSIVATFSQPGELFGEVFLFLGREAYGHYAQAAAAARVLRIPKEFLYHPCEKSCSCHAKLISNMLSILARKAYLLNQRLQIMSCATLRQKIALALLQSAAVEETLPSMSREDLADYLGAARPSVSRELMRMQRDGLLKIDKKRISLQREALQDLF